MLDKIASKKELKSANTTETTEVKKNNDNEQTSSKKETVSTEKESADDNWKQAYADYIDENFPDDETTELGTYGWIFELVYIDDDDIPEIYAEGPGYANGCALLSYSNGQVVYTQMSSGSLSYIEKENICHSSGGLRGHYRDTIFHLENGASVIDSYGEYEEVYVDNDFYTWNGDYFYTWNGEEVSESEYEQSLKTAFNSASVEITEPQITKRNIVLMLGVIRFN